MAGNIYTYQDKLRDDEYQRQQEAERVGLETYLDAGMDIAKGFATPDYDVENIRRSYAPTSVYAGYDPGEFDYESSEAMIEEAVAAQKEKGERIGSGIGTALGSIFGPGGSMIGGKVGEFAGRLFGSGFGRTRRRAEEQMAMAQQKHMGQRQKFDEQQRQEALTKARQEQFSPPPSNVYNMNYAKYF